MKAFALLLLTFPAFANPFLVLETAHNLGDPMTKAMTPRAAERWDSMFTEGRGIGTFTDVKMSTISPDVGIANWGWHRDGKTQNGQLIITTKDGKIDSFYYTERPRKPRNTALEGQAADSATTMIGLGMGAVEANPMMAALPGPAIGAVKIGATYAMQRYAGPETCVGFSQVAGPAGYAAAAWNIGVLAGLGPIGAIPAIGVAIATHKYGSDPIWACLPGDL